MPRRNFVRGRMWLLNAIGFTVNGVAKSSAAAAIQSSIGNVAQHSLFAKLTSAGATAGGCTIL